VPSSFLKQKNSRSRVNATAAFFEAFASLNGVSLNLEEMIACFGVPGGEHELGPPMPRCQWSSSGDGNSAHYLGKISSEEKW
jgi:hypothetical protein